MFKRLFFIALSISCLFSFAVAQDVSLVHSPEIKNNKVLKIRRIEIKVREIFDESGVELFYRATNALKIQTKENIVRRELLFKEGDTFDPFLIEESERNLRNLSFLREAKISLVEDGEWVDLVVQVQDTWTLFPFLAFNSGGGTSRSGVGIAENNLLGYGKKTELLYAKDEGRQKIEAIWQDPRLFGSYQQLTAAHFQRSDGDRTFLSYGRPFRSVIEQYAWSSQADAFDLVGRLFAAGEERYIFRQKQRYLQGGFTTSYGDPKHLRRRYNFGYIFEDQDFSQAEKEDFEDIELEFNPRLNNSELLPADRRFSGPVFGYQQITQNFISTNYIDRFQRVEDYNLGNEFNFSFQVAPEFFDSIRDTALINFGDSQGIKFSDTAFLRAGISGAFRTDEQGIDNAILKAELKFYKICGNSNPQDLFYFGRHTIAANLSLDLGEDLDRDFEFILGANNGLRGYADRSFTGDHRIVLNLEDRMHFVDEVLRLVSVGGVVFFDAGGVSRESLGDILKDNLYADFGLGLRFGLTRSSGGSVVRVDLAFPLRDGTDDNKKLDPQLLISTGQAFSSFLSAERISNAPRTGAGYL
jgi:outer membrane protein assembly factor BamA